MLIGIRGDRAFYPRLTSLHRPSAVFHFLSSFLHYRIHNKLLSLALSFLPPFRRCVCSAGTTGTRSSFNPYIGLLYCISTIYIDMYTHHRTPCCNASTLRVTTATAPLRGLSSIYCSLQRSRPLFNAYQASATCHVQYRNDNDMDKIFPDKDKIFYLWKIRFSFE